MYRCTSQLTNIPSKSPFVSAMKTGTPYCGGRLVLAPEKIKAFFQQLTEMDAQLMAILEVCGFNDWLIEVLRTLHRVRKRKNQCFRAGT